MRATVETVKPLDIAELRAAVVRELEGRRCGGEATSYADERGAGESLYGVIGAVNVAAALGLPLGDRAARAEWAGRILGYRDAAGHFTSRSGPRHAVHMALGALNLLGEPIPAGIGPLAPVAPAALSAWLERHDWHSTHKGLCGPTIPLLASGLAGAGWVEVFLRHVAGRLGPARPLETWCAPDDPPWRVISCVYHVLSAFDAGRLPYPHPELLLRRMIDLRWDAVPDVEQRTVCTDGDWALVLRNLCDALPHEAERVMAAIRRVSARRVRRWHERPGAVLGLGTFDLYCYLWVTAVFQSCVREHYTGGFVRDTLNDPALFRL